MSQFYEQPGRRHSGWTPADDTVQDLADGRHSPEPCGHEWLSSPLVVLWSGGRHSPTSESLLVWFFFFN